MPGLRQLHNGPQRNLPEVQYLRRNDGMLMTAIFVFGSNREGRHGKGAALVARIRYGAINGQGEGLQGESYAIPTKETPYETLSLVAIARHVMKFNEFAASRPDLTFTLTPIGCGLAGYTPEQIAPMFAHAPANVILPPAFRAVLS